MNFPPKTFTRLAAKIVDLCSGYLRTLDERSTFPQTTGEESKRLFDLDLADVVNHYNSCFSLGLTAQEQGDVVEYMKSLPRRK